MLRLVLVLLLLVLPLTQLASAQSSGPARATLVSGQTQTRLVSIFPQTRTDHSRFAGNVVEQWAVFPGLSASARASPDVTFLFLLASGTQPQGLATLTPVGPNRSSRLLYIGGGAGFGLEPRNVIAMRFDVLAPLPDTPPGFTLYRATPSRPLSRGEYAIVLADPISASPYSEMPVSYYDFGVDR